MLFERSILTVSVLATVAFVAAGIHAHAVSVEADLGFHVLLTLASALLVVFPHLWVVLYLWGTGRAVKKEVEARRASPRMRSRVRRYRLHAWPPALLASAAALGTVMLGRDALVGPTATPHRVLFFTTLVLQAWALWAERRVLWDNAALLDDLEKRAAEPPVRTPASA